MSTIGAGSIGVLNLAGSLAGAQRNNATADQARGDAAEKSFQIDKARLTAQSMGDISDPELSSDRDADGRLPYDAPRRPDALAEEGVDAMKKAPISVIDLSGERGRMLDIQA